jgi:hypothetical protein
MVRGSPPAIASAPLGFLVWGLGGMGLTRGDRGGQERGGRLEWTERGTWRPARCLHRGRAFGTDLGSGAGRQARSRAAVVGNLGCSG